MLNSLKRRRERHRKLYLGIVGESIGLSNTSDRIVFISVFLYSATTLVMGQGRRIPNKYPFSYFFWTICYQRHKRWAIFLLKNKMSVVLGHNLLWCHTHNYDYNTFSFSSTSVDVSAGTEGQTAGLGQGSKLREALLKRTGTALNLENDTNCDVTNLALHD